MKEILKQGIIENIKDWTAEDIYAISLFVYDDDDNPCKPTVTLGYNTERQVHAETANAFGENEARWNYAFWIQNSCFEFGMDESAEIVKKWIIDNGFPYYENVYGDWDDEAGEIPADFYDITKRFVEVLVEIVQEIHAQGILTEKFGREIPILIHELEYYEEIAEQNIRANGEELVSDFANWCREY